MKFNTRDEIWKHYFPRDYKQQKMKKGTPEEIAEIISKEVKKDVQKRS